MLQDKIQHHIIKINQLQSENEEAKYIIPLFYTAIKYIHDNCSHYSIEPSLIEHLTVKFATFKKNQAPFLSLFDQVHQYMLEQAQSMLEAKQCKSIVKFKRNKLSILDQPQHQKEQEMIFINQESYNYEGKATESIAKFIKSESSSSELPIKKSIITDQRITLDGVSYISYEQSDIDIVQNRMRKYYNDHQIYQAFVEMEKYENLAFIHNPNLQLCDQKMNFIARIHHEYDTVSQFYQYFDEPGYIFDKEDKGISMYYKVYEDTKQVGIQMDGQVEVSIENFLCIVSEVDYFQDYVPFAYETKELKQLNRNQKIGLSRVYLPLLSNREAYFYAAAYDMLQKYGSIFFYSKTITKDLELQKKYGYAVPQNSELVDLQYKFYILEYKPINLQRGKIRIATSVDLKLKYLPMFIINKSARIFAFDYFKNLLKVNKHFQGSKWEEKMKQNPDIYNHFKKRVAQFLNSK